jgi:hypothetical protein
MWRRLRALLTNPHPPTWANAGVWGISALIASAILWIVIPASGLWLLTAARLLALAALALALIAALTRRLAEIQYYRIICDFIDRRCPQCRYDLKGLSTPNCPECGVNLVALADDAARLVKIEPPKPLEATPAASLK